MAALLPSHGGNLRAAAEKYGLDIKKLVDFSANINPLGPSKQAVAAIMNNLELIAHYPDPECNELRDYLAADLGLSQKNLIMGNGAVELIFILMHVLKPKRVLLPAPTFGEYAVAVQSVGGTIQSFPLNREENFVLNIENLIGCLSGIDAVIICNPNNPTGMMLSQEKMERILGEAHKRGIWVIVDEAFMDFVRDKEKYSVVSMVKQYPNLFILYSLTKFYAVPGLRLGAGIAEENLIERLKLAKDPWNVNALAQVAGIASMKDDAYREKTIELVEQEKDFLYSQLKEIKGFQPFQPTVNYIFIDIRETGMTSTQLMEKMGRTGILVRDCSTYQNLGTGYIRVAVRSRAENERLLTGLRQVISNGHEGVGI